MLNIIIFFFFGVCVSFINKKLNLSNPFSFVLLKAQVNTFRELLKLTGKKVAIYTCIEFFMQYFYSLDFSI